MPAVCSTRQMFFSRPLWCMLHGLCAGCQFVPLLALGVLLGLLFVHTRNLLAPVLLHCLWNLYIFFELTRGAAALAL